MNRILPYEQPSALTKIINTLEKGNIIAYPTEGVYGLGCDPMQPDAVEKIYILKERERHKSFIIISHDWDCVAPWTLPLPNLTTILNTWPGPITWILPASSAAPTYLVSNGTIAIRITAHPFSRRLCEGFKRPLISTSANKAHQPPCLTAMEVQQAFLMDEAITWIIDAPLGNQSGPTEIRDGITGKVLRS